ncbi:MAG: hypothetical protein VW522_12200 [Candidatus Neomarinimicrobiota bacterium]
MSSTEDKLKPLRHFSGMRVYKTYPEFNEASIKLDIDNLGEDGKNLKISCSLHDEGGNRISETNIHKDNNDEKGFLFRIWNGGVYLLEIHHFGKLVKYEFCESIHEAWVPEIEAIDLLEESQTKGFTIFKRLLDKTEKINGFPITDERHEVFYKPEFRSLLLRILNSSKYLSIK